MSVVRLRLARLVAIACCKTDVWMKCGALVAAERELQNQAVCRLTYVSQVDEAVLADVGAGAGLRSDDGIAALFIADDAELR